MMGSFIKDLWKTSKLLFVLLLICVMMLAVVLLMGWAVIKSSIDNEHNYIPEGKVVSKEYIPAHDILVGKVLVYEAGEYQVTITDGKKDYSTDVSQADYKKLNIGDSYTVKN